MKFKIILWIVTIFMALPTFGQSPQKTQTTQPTKEKKETMKYVEESHSYAQPNKAAIRHLDLDINLDFSKKIISGIASYQIDNNNANEIILDSKFLNILNVKAPQQTADKTHPFLFTQGQAILTRTWIPIQDSPQLRITYGATVKVPAGLMAVMSAENPQKETEDGIYTFSMKQSISPYLIALAVGDIKYKAISERTGVYAEKSMLDKVHYEFSDMEKMVVAAEELYGKYEWEQFDVIVLPPSFPFGGMENPRLTFATPTIIAGDKSLTSLVAHELAHSWSGNLVTNATWDDFWLNEGFTVYFEMRIMEALYGKDRANMLAHIARQQLSDEIEGFKNTPDETKLKHNLKGRNPDDGMTSIPYDKGYLFLRTIEEQEGIGREKFDAFLKTYFESHAFSTMSTERFIVYLNENLLDKYGVEFNTEEWIYQPGIPSNQAIIASDKFDKVEQTLQQILNSNKADASETKDWTTQEWVHFVKNLPEDISLKQLSLIDDTFDLTNSSNSYITMVWFEKAVAKNYHGNGIDERVENFLTTVGRRWYVSTIYRAFKKAGRVEEALKIYAKARPNYHSVTANTIDDLLGF